MLAYNPLFARHLNVDSQTNRKHNVPTIIKLQSLFARRKPQNPANIVVVTHTLLTVFFLNLLVASRFSERPIQRRRQHGYKGRMSVGCLPVLIEQWTFITADQHMNKKAHTQRVFYLPC